MSPEFRAPPKDGGRRREGGRGEKVLEGVLPQLKMESASAMIVIQTRRQGWQGSELRFKVYD